MRGLAGRHAVRRYGSSGSRTAGGLSTEYGHCYSAPLPAVALQRPAVSAAASSAALFSSPRPRPGRQLAAARVIIPRSRQHLWRRPHYKGGRRSGGPAAAAAFSPWPGCVRRRPRRRRSSCEGGGTAPNLPARARRTGFDLVVFVQRQREATRLACFTAESRAART